MKQYPSRFKYRKNHKIALSNLHLKQQKIFNPLRGILFLKTIENGRLNYKQIEACRKAIRRMMKKQGVVFLRVFTNLSLTKKPVATRMGSGKGSHDIWVTVIRKGQIIVELIFFSILNYEMSYKALKSGSSKLPVKTKIGWNYF